jgi:EAL domain-containing protein (putative c-di-GMP-specific phosphodiesterase class I)
MTIDFAPLPQTSMSVLVVDDDQSLLRLLSRQLQRAGLSVRCCASVEVARAELQVQVPDVLLVDMHMPRENGLSLIRRLGHAGDTIPIVMMSAQPDVDSALGAMEMGVVRFLRKPVTAAEVVKALFLAVRQNHARREQEARAAAQREAQQARLLRSQSLDAAIAELYAVWQPIICARSGQIRAVEALMRSRGEMASPAAILQAARELGRSTEVELSMWRHIASVIPQLPAQVDAFVNVHPDTLTQGLLSDRSGPLAALAERVVLEITEESSEMGDMGLSRELARVRSLGFRVAIDDFGSLHANFWRLEALRPSFVKLDRGLVSKVDQHGMRRRFVSSLVDACQSEGVERPEESSLLMSLGVDCLQGYLLRRPGPLEEALAPIPRARYALTEGAT